jgi:hypothetical protein
MSGVIPPLPQYAFMALCSVKKSTGTTLPLLIPWSTDLLEKLTVTQLVKTFPAFYGTRSFITVFTRVRHWSLFWARWIQSTPPHTIYLKSILILSFYLRLIFRIVSYFLGFSTEFFLLISEEFSVMHLISVDRKQKLSSTLGTELRLTVIRRTETHLLLNPKGKGKVLPVFNWAPRHEGVSGEWRYSSTHSLTSALDGGVVSFTPRPLYPQEKSPRYPLDRRLGGP